MFSDFFHEEGVNKFNHNSSSSLYVTFNYLIPFRDMYYFLVGASTQYLHDETATNYHEVACHFEQRNLTSFEKWFWVRATDFCYFASGY